MFFAGWPGKGAKTWHRQGGYQVSADGNFLAEGGQKLENGKVGNPRFDKRVFLGSGALGCKINSRGVQKYVKRFKIIIFFNVFPPSGVLNNTISRAISVYSGIRIKAVFA